MKINNLVFVVLVIVLQSCSSTQKREMRLDISVSPHQLELVNRDSLWFENVEVRINDQWQFLIPHFTIGERVLMNLSDFSDGDGKRFDPVIYAVKEVEVSAVNKAEGVESSYHFQPGRQAQGDTMP